MKKNTGLGKRVEHFRPRDDDAFLPRGGTVVSHASHVLRGCCSSMHCFPHMEQLPPPQEVQLARCLVCMPLQSFRALSPYFRCQREFFRRTRGEVSEGHGITITTRLGCRWTIPRVVLRPTHKFALEAEMQRMSVEDEGKEMKIFQSTVVCCVVPRRAQAVNSCMKN